MAGRKRRKTYKFPKRKKYNEIPIFRPKRTSDDEGLVGFVRGYRASDIEERFALALERLGIKFWFQYEVETELSLPNQDRRVDFIVFYSSKLIYPIEIYGERWHGSSGDQNRDRARRDEIDREGKKYGWQPVQFVWGKELYNLDVAYNTARRLFH